MPANIPQTTPAALPVDPTATVPTDKPTSVEKQATAAQAKAYPNVAASEGVLLPAILERLAAHVDSNTPIDPRKFAKDLIRSLKEQGHNVGAFGGDIAKKLGI